MKKNHTLTNRDISEQYRNTEFYLMKSELLGTLASLLVQQSPYDVPNINKALKSYNKFLKGKFDTVDKVVKFTYEELSKYISDDVFESIPEIEIFNHSKKDSGEGFIASSSRYHKTKADYDFVDLGALSRNIFYEICRNHITQPL
jgi:hypothetical protein